MCAVADIGMAAAAVNKLAEQDPAYAEVAQQLSEKNVKIQSAGASKSIRIRRKRPRKRRSRPKNRQRRSRSAPTVSRPARSVPIGRTMRISVLTVKPTAISARTVRKATVRIARTTAISACSARTANPVRIARMTARSARSARTATVRIARTTARSARSAKTANPVRIARTTARSVRSAKTANAARTVKRCRQAELQQRQAQLPQ